MSTADHIRESEGRPDGDSARGMRFAIAVSDWNREITGALLEGALTVLRQNGVRQEDIRTWHVPGSFELTFAARCLMRSGKADAVICLGSVVRGETPHFDYVCQGVTQGMAQLNALGEIPVIFGLLTTEDMDQARERAGGKLGNKGSECALTAIKMVQLNLEIQKKT